MRSDYGPLMCLLLTIRYRRQEYESDRGRIR